MENNLSIELKKKYSFLAFKWCKQKFGINKRKRKILKFSPRKNFKSKNDYDEFGAYYYSENRIVIYLKNCDNMDDIVSTVIHEYSHYLQSFKKYSEYQKTYLYDDNPFEIEANNFEELYKEDCMNYIKSLFNHDFRINDLP